MASRSARLRLVPPAGPAQIDIAAQARAEIRARDWTRVHVEGDRNPPINLWPRRWLYAGEGSRRERGGFRDGGC